MRSKTSTCVRVRDLREARKREREVGERERERVPGHAHLCSWFNSMKGGHHHHRHHRGCGCQHLFRKVLAKCGCCYARVRDSYSAAGSEGSISTSVASLPPQASGSSAPSSPGSRRSVSTLKKWLTNPVRKLSAGSTAKGERQVRKLEGKPPPLPSHSHSQDLGSPPRPDDTLTILPVTHRELEWKDGLASPEDLSPATLQSPSYITDSLIGCTSLPNAQVGYKANT